MTSGEVSAHDYWLVLSTLRQDVDPAWLHDVLPAHLQWVEALEQEGVVFLSGPLLPAPGAPSGAGATVIRAADGAAATELAGQDPFVQAGLRTFAVHQWRVNEGSLQVKLFLGAGRLEWR